MRINAEASPWTRKSPGRALWNALVVVVIACMAWVSGPARALTSEQALRIASGDGDARIEALYTAASQHVPPGDALKSFLTALLDDAVKVEGERALIVQGSQAVEAASRATASVSSAAEDVVMNNRMRREIQAVRAALALTDPDRAVRANAATQWPDDADPRLGSLLNRALESETDSSLKATLVMLQARVKLSSDNADDRLQAAKSLGSDIQNATRTLLRERMTSETDANVKREMQQAINSIESRMAWGERLGLLFTGMSLGSILLLAALGLAITYGLMGVINMAHGELMMVGAYATYVVQGLVKQHAPGWFDGYILLAIPVSFLAAVLVGALMERIVIRHLYGRPLETLLATWGISLILMQSARSIFGAQNVPLENPSWMSGGVQVMGNLTLPYNRIALMVFVVLVLVGVTLAITQTRLGLFVRGVTQNRSMAACVGINTQRVDLMAFSLGAGLAGLAGCALSQVGNVGPDLGQSYIVDSFMVVVLGGVGQLTGTVVAALGLGVANKLIEGVAGAVLAKIAILLLIVLFIQKRPQGLFALRGRGAEA
jgi:urea transport system permease protein